MDICSIKRHPLQLHPAMQRTKATSSAPSWPSYTGASTLAGTTVDGRCTVYFDASLGIPCQENATALLADAARVMSFNDATFAHPGGPVNVIVFALGGNTDGTGGADHMACDFQNGQNIEVCAAFGAPERVSALFEAELSECSMGGNVCGESTGEALSRWCAMQVSSNALSDFASGPTWAANGMPNFVDSTDGTDQNYDSTGCGMVFISYLLSKGMTLPEVAQKMVQLGDAGTLAQINPSYQWADFIAAVQALAGGVQSDDPFGGSAPTPPPEPTPPPSPPPTPTPPSGIFWAELACDALLHGVAAGETATQIKADIDSIPT